MKYLFYIFVLFFLFQNSFAQSNRLAGISYTYFPESSIKEEVPEDPKLTFNEIRAFFTIPKSYNDKATILINGLDYKLTYSLIDGERDLTSKMHQLSYNFGLVQALENDWKVTTIIVPTIASGFEEGLDGDDFIMQAAVSFTKKKNKTFFYGLGLSVNTRFGEPLLMPLVQIRKIYDNSELNLILPASINYRYDVSEKLKLGASLVVNGGQFNIHSEIANTNTKYYEQIDYSRVILGPKLIYRVNNLLILESFAGVAASRTFKLTDGDNSRFDFSLENGSFIQVGIYFFPKIKKEEE